MNSLGGATSIAQKNIFIKFPVLNTSKDKIINLKSIDNTSDIKIIEDKINQFLYKLYYLTNEEIKFIENATNNYL